MFNLPKMMTAEKVIYSMIPTISFGFNGIPLCNAFLEKAFKDARTASKFSKANWYYDVLEWSGYEVNCIRKVA